MNIKRFRELADVIEAADRFDMRFVAAGNDGLNPEYLVYDCGTVGCIGGWALATYGNDPSRDWSDAAGEHLGLNYGQEKRLFLAVTDSVWSEHAERYGWVVDDDGLVGWDQITATQAAQMLREIADGTVTL